MAATEYEELAAELREQIDERARDASPPAEVWTVVNASPLVIEREDEDDRLEEGDEDFSISASIADAELSVGDDVLVVRDADGDYLAAAPLGGGGALGRHAAKHKGVHGLPDAPTNGRGVVWNDATQQWDVAPDFATAAALAALDVATDTRLDALEALTPYATVSRSAQALTANVWNIIGFNGVGRTQNTSGVLSLQTGAPQHVRIDKAGVYVVECDFIYSAGTGDHLVFIGRNAAATAIVAAGADEIVQQRTGATTNDAVTHIVVPVMCALSDKIHAQAWTSTAASTITTTMRITRIGP